MKRPLQQFWSLDLHSKLLCCKIYGLLGWYRLLLLSVSFKRLVRGLEHFRAEPPREHRLPSPRAQHLALLVAAAARHTPWKSTCLVQVITLQRLLARAGIGGRFYLGVGKNEKSGEILAHAWLRCGGEVINGDRELEKYTVISTYTWAWR